MMAKLERGVSIPVMRKDTNTHEILGKIRELELALHRLLQAIPEDPSGCIVYKWVRNKRGKKYYYYYLHVRDGGKLIAIYLGKNADRAAAIRRAKRLRKAILQALLKLEQLEHEIRWLNERGA